MHQTEETTPLTAYIKQFPKKNTSITCHIWLTHPSPQNFRTSQYILNVLSNGYDRKHLKSLIKGENTATGNAFYILRSDNAEKLRSEKSTSSVVPTSKAPLVPLLKESYIYIFVHRSNNTVTFLPSYLLSLQTVYNDASLVTSTSL